MSIERSLYTVPFYVSKPPRYSCPICTIGILILDTKSFIYQETIASKERTKDAADWEEDWKEYIYSAWFNCSNPDCKGRIVSVGEGTGEYSTVDNGKGEPEMIFEEYFEPKYFTPHLILYNLPSETPGNIKTFIYKSFSLFFANSSSSSNQLRVALELILDYLKVKKYEVSRGKRVVLSLHRRIELISQSHSSLKDSFMAVKWLGNAGSHSLEITEHDVIDANIIMEHILNELFEKSKKHTQKLIKEINKRKGPKHKNIPF